MARDRSGVLVRRQGEGGKGAANLQELRGSSKSASQGDYLTTDLAT